MLVESTEMTLTRAAVESDDDPNASWTAPNSFAYVPSVDHR